MRGYGAWCMGWNEAERTKYRPSNNNNSGSGCLIIFFVLLAFCFFKVAFETGNFLGFLFGLAVLVGAFKK